MKWMLYLLMVVVAVESQAHGKILGANEGRLLCYKYLQYKHNSRSRADFVDFNVPAENLSEHIAKLVKGKIGRRSKFLTLPAPRDGKNGFYLISEVNSTWVELPPEKNSAGDLVTEDGKQIYLTECFRFNDEHNLNGELFVNYGNYNSFTQPGSISKTKPEISKTVQCKETKFSDLSNPQFMQDFAKDLIDRVQHTRTRLEKVKSIYFERKKNGDMTYKELESDPKELMGALNACLENLSEVRDKEIIEEINLVKTYINTETKWSTGTDLQK